MKTLEKNELKNVIGGFLTLNCENMGFNRSRCSYHNSASGIACEGVYTWGGETITIDCWRPEDLNGN